jgi:hypothetical protein
MRAVKAGSLLFSNGRSIVPQKRLLFLLSVVTLLLAIEILVWFPTQSSSAIGTVTGGFAGILAVIWFSAGLYYQSQQLKEQREQFLENFKQLREDNRRSSLILAKDILVRAEERALKSNPDLKSIGELTAYYMNLPDGSIIRKSTDPTAVLEAGKKWMLTQEGPALYLMRGMKNAAEVYFRAVGDDNIDYSMEPELFVLTYGPTLWKLPFFEEYACIGLLPDFMVHLTAVRATLKLAYFVAAFKQATRDGVGDMFKEDKIMEDIRRHKEAGYPVPAIAEDLAERME